MTVMIDVTKSGERIKALKKQCGLTSPEIADMLHVSQQAVYQWESGKKMPSLDNALALAKIFRVHVEDILVCAEDPLPRTA